MSGGMHNAEYQKNIAAAKREVQRDAARFEALRLECIRRYPELIELLDLMRRYPHWSPTDA